LKAYPFTEVLTDFISRHEKIYIVEQNRDAQLMALMRMEFPVELLARLKSIRYYGGMPLDARTVTDAFVTQEGL
jgi:2-oxoglutarate ferredoxin oxidoreductase subunit alpha